MKNTFKYLMFALLMALLCCDSVGREQVSIVNVPVQERAKIEQLARTDQIAMLEWAMEHYTKTVRDYEGTLYKQERISGKIGKEQVVSFKFKEKPFSVFMQWQKKTGPIDKLLFVEGKYDNKMIVHPRGFFVGWIKSLKFDPHGKEARKVSLRTCDEFGLYRMMREMLRLCRLADDGSGLKVKYIEEKVFDKRKCIELEILLPIDPRYNQRRVVLRIDTEYMMPVYVASYDARNELIGKYSHKDLQFNVGLPDSYFTPGARF